MPGKSKKGGGLEVKSAYKMRGFSGFGNSPMKTDPNKKVKKKSSSDDDYNFGHGAKIWRKKGSISGKHTGGFGLTNKKGKAFAEVEHLTKGLAETLRRMDYSKSEINTLWEHGGAKPPYNQ